ncbi:MAG: glutamate-5-semialdehyde dehydrogenase [Acidobacteria bacterium]|nr:glutamate-5-semialdehyde dehydrogenase [Acidobacteriota bacterium]
MAELCAAAHEAAPAVAASGRDVRDAALEAIAAGLEASCAEILEANAADLEAGREAGLSDALIDRLALDEGRIATIAAGARAVAALDDPVGELLEERTLDNGLELRKLRVPLGVVAVVYEARPNVTIDSAALCLGSGNAVVLRGSASAARTNEVLARIAAEGVAQAGLPAEAVTLIGGGERSELAELATQDRTVDLIIPRGGEGLKKALEGVATVPVIFAAAGNCHVYVDAGADVAMAVRIAVNAKVQRPGVCNAAETLLVHRDIAPGFLPLAAAELIAAGVELRADERALAAMGAELAGQVSRATEEDWATEFLAPVLAVGVVDSLEEAVEHIGRYGSRHSEAIVTDDPGAAREFELGVDAACVYVNASTRFTDGGEFGMGAEIGNSTQKLHVRGPIGLRELCTYKYVVTGNGQIRE